ncbi:MAG: hypothetical protein RIB59_09760 [Rhodospirillales bacterium]
MAERQDGEIGWGKVFRVWWLLVWRWLAGMLIIGGGLGYLLGLLLGKAGAGPQTITAIHSIIGLGIFVFWGLAVVRMALNKYYRDFRITLT